jgi:hypothetical protein
MSANSWLYIGHKIRFVLLFLLIAPLLPIASCAQSLPANFPHLQFTYAACIVMLSLATGGLRSDDVTEFQTSTLQVCTSSRSRAGEGEF